MKRLLLAALTLGPRILLGQENQPPSFPARTDVVVLDLVVRDRAGRAVTDLRPKDIGVLEDGVPCPLQSLRLVCPAAAADAASATVASGDSGGGAAGSQAPLRPNIVILVFDRLGAEAAAAAGRAAIDFVGRGFPARTWLAVYTLDGRVPVAWQATTDPAALVPMIEQATSGAAALRMTAGPESTSLTKQALAEALVALGDTAGVGAVDALLAPMIRGANAIERMQYQAQASMDTLADTLNRQRLGGGALRALLAIARQLAGLEGRKTLLYFSEGLHLPAGLTQLLDVVVSEANRTNLAVYAVNPAGLLTESSHDDAKLALLTARGASERVQRRRDSESRSRTETTSPEREQKADSTEIHSHDTAEDALHLDTQANLRDLAESTGGFLVANTNALAASLERIGTDLRCYYEAAYYSADPTADGRFRAIRVSVSRPKVSVRTRRGYFARAGDEAAPIAAYELTLAQAFELEPAPRDFVHSVVTELRGGTPEGREVQLSLQVPLGGLRFDTDAAENRYRARFSALALVRDADGRVVERLSHDWPLAGPLGEAPNVKRQNATVKRTIALPLGEYTLETVVGDRLAGSISVLRTPLSVTSPPAAPDGH